MIKVSMAQNQCIQVLWPDMRREKWLPVHLNAIVEQHPAPFGFYNKGRPAHLACRSQTFVWPSNHDRSDSQGLGPQGWQDHHWFPWNRRHRILDNTVPYSETECREDRIS